MRLLALLVAVGLLAAAIAPSPTDAGDLVDVLGVREAEAASARAVTVAALPCRRNVQTTSSGVVLESGLVLTVAHAVFEAREFAVQDASGRWYDASIRSLDVATDLAVLEVDNLDVDVFGTTTVAHATARAGDRVVMVEGATSGSVAGEVVRRVRLRTALVGDLSRDAERRGFEVDLAIDGGDSGAALLNERGDLVAVMFARSRRRPGRSWATSAAEITAVLESSEVPEWNCGVGFDTTLDLPEPQELASG